MTVTSILKCYLCGGTEHRRRPGKVRDDETLEVLECLACGLVFLSKTEKPAGFYEQGGMHGDAPFSVEEWLRDTDRDDARRFRYLSDEMTNHDLLDFGCGAGGFMMRARTRARSVTGVELETRLKPHYSANGLNVVEGLDRLKAEAKFDLITAFHVVEHLEDPISMLRLLSKRLTPRGRLIIEVPSPGDALLTLFGSSAFSQFTYWSCHLYLFNAANVPALAAKAGMKVDYVKNIQRYPLSNHLHWLAKGKPGGHQLWSFLDDPVLTLAYEARLAALGITDTIMAGFSPAGSK